TAQTLLPRGVHRERQDTPAKRVLHELTGHARLWNGVHSPSAPREAERPTPGHMDPVLVPDRLTEGDHSAGAVTPDVRRAVGYVRRRGCRRAVLGDRELHVGLNDP